MAKLQIAASVEVAHEAGRVEDLVEGRIIDHTSTDPSQNFCWTMTVIIPLAMGPMNLIVEVGNKLVVGSNQLCPAGGALEMPVCHPAHHIEVGFDKARPALPARNRCVFDPQRLI